VVASRVTSAMTEVVIADHSQASLAMLKALQQISPVKTAMVSTAIVTASAAAIAFSQTQVRVET
jgi:hypothetical protein